MCNIIVERIRINKLLRDAAEIFSRNADRSEEALVDICVTALHASYAGLCPDEALEEKARNFSAWFVLRQAEGASLNQALA